MYQASHKNIISVTRGHFAIRREVPMEVRGIRASFSLMITVPRNGPGERLFLAYKSGKRLILLLKRFPYISKRQRQNLPLHFLMEML